MRRGRDGNRQFVSYAVEADGRAHAYLAIPEGLTGPAPAIVVLHGTYKDANLGVAGLAPGYELPFLDDLACRGYIAIAPRHFVADRTYGAEPGSILTI